MSLPRNRGRTPAGVDESRIPPGQTLTAPDRWPLLHFGPVPHLDLADWDFRVFGLVEGDVDGKPMSKRWTFTVASGSAT